MAKILVKDSTVKINKTMKPYSPEDFFIRGLIVLDKPAGPRCREVVSDIKELLELSHAGHAGTLDPKVTGVLPIGLEKTTKVLGILSVYPKTYEGEMKIHHEIQLSQLKSGAKKFTGKIRQLPPKLSAVKRVYRTREVYSFDILQFKDQIAKYKVHCEAGTYIRKLCHDLGEHLKTGAHMTKLRRTQSGPFTLKDSVTFDEVQKNYKKFLQDNNTKHLRKIINPVEVVIKDMPKVWIDDVAVEKVNLGSPVFVPGVLQLTDDIKKDAVVAMLTRQNRLFGLGKAKMTSKEIMSKEKGLAVKTDTILTVRT